jgi:hypothetical protein
VADGTCTGDRKRIRFGIAKLASLRRGQCGGMGPTDRKICFQSDGNAGVIGFEESQANVNASKNLFRNLTK